MATLKQRKEEFVSGLTGSAITEINCVGTVAIAAYLGFVIVSKKCGGRVPFYVDFLLNWCAPLLSVTVYSEAPLLLNILLLSPCLLFYFVSSNHVQREDSRSKTQKKKTPQFQITRKPFITAYRSSMLILTCICIFAVDFPIFPRRFAKVETWGTSLMDLGVGSFVFSKGVALASVAIKNEISGRRPSLGANVIAALRASAALLVLGILRLLSVKSLDYQEHETEYGTHWNFFFTLAFLPPMISLLEPLAIFVPRIVLAFALSIVSELILSREGFLEFMILSPRDNLLSANREGIISFLGYCAILLLGQSVGCSLLGNSVTCNNLYKPSSVLISKRGKYITRWDQITSATPLRGLFSYVIVLVPLCQLVFHFYPYNVSRRFANFPYVLWVASFNVSFLMLYALVDYLFAQGSSNIPSTMDTVNANGLAVFVIANVLTGLINMKMATLDATPALSMFVLLTYLFVISALSILAYRHRVFIKL